MIRLTRTQLRRLIIESSKFADVYFDIEKNPQKYRDRVMDQLAADGLLSDEYAAKLKDLDMADRENWAEVAELAMTLTDKDSLGSDFVDEEMLLNIDAGVRDELIASVVEFAQTYDAGYQATLNDMQKAFEADIITETDLDNVKKIMRVVPGVKKWYTAPGLRPSRISEKYSYGTQPNSDIASFFLKLQAYYHNIRKASSYEDMIFLQDTDAYGSDIGKVSAEIEALCDKVVEEGLATKVTDLYIFDPMWVESNTMGGILTSDRRKLMSDIEKLIGQHINQSDL